VEREREGEGGREGEREREREKVLQSFVMCVILDEINVKN